MHELVRQFLLHHGHVSTLKLLPCVVSKSHDKAVSQVLQVEQLCATDTRVDELSTCQATCQAVRRFMENSDSLGAIRLLKSVYPSFLKESRLANAMLLSQAMIEHLVRGDLPGAVAFAKESLAPLLLGDAARGDEDGPYACDAAMREGCAADGAEEEWQAEADDYVRCPQAVAPGSRTRGCCACAMRPWDLGPPRAVAEAACVRAEGPARRSVQGGGSPQGRGGKGREHSGQTSGIAYSAIRFARSASRVPHASASSSGRAWHGCGLPTSLLAGGACALQRVCQHGGSGEPVRQCRGPGSAGVKGEARQCAASWARFLDSDASWARVLECCSAMVPRSSLGPHLTAAPGGVGCSVPMDHFVPSRSKPAARHSKPAARQTNG